MEDSARIDARIASLSELRDLFSAIEAMAAARVQAAQSALASARRYTEVIETAIAEAASLDRSGVPLDIWAEEIASSALVVIGSEQGFTGAFNRLLIERAAQELSTDEALVVVGRRGAALATEHGLEPEQSISMATRIEGVLSTARQLAAALKDRSEIRVIFGRHSATGEFDTVVRQVLPPDRNVFEKSDGANPPLHQMPAELLLHKLIGELLLAELMLALTESFASENTARLQIMQSADHNIGDKLERLTVQSRQMRQEQITSELLEVVAGAEAISASSQNGAR